MSCEHVRARKVTACTGKFQNLAVGETMTAPTAEFQDLTVGETLTARDGEFQDLTVEGTVSAHEGKFQELTIYGTFPLFNLQVGNGEPTTVVQGELLRLQSESLLLRETKGSILVEIEPYLVSAPGLPTATGFEGQTSINTLTGGVYVYNSGAWEFQNIMGGTSGYTQTILQGPVAKSVVIAQGDLFENNLILTDAKGTMVVKAIPSDSATTILTYLRVSGSKLLQQIADPLVGVASLDSNDASRVSLSGDGSTLLLSDRLNPVINTWRLTGTTWVPLDPRATAGANQPAEINHNGDRIATVGPSIVTVYELVGTAWVMVGLPVAIGAQGVSLDLNDAGDRFIVGDSTGDGVAQVFAFQAGTWVQVGLDLTPDPPGEGVDYGYVVSMNGSGDRVVVAYENSGTSLDVWDWVAGAWVRSPITFGTERDCFLLSIASASSDVIIAGVHGAKSTVVLRLVDGVWGIDDLLTPKVLNSEEVSYLSAAVSADGRTVYSSIARNDEFGPTNLVNVWTREG